MPVGNIVTQALGIDFIKAQWIKALDNFKASERKFRVAYDDLLANKKRYYAAGLQKEYDFAFAKGRVIQNSVESVINASKKIYDYFNTQTTLGTPFIAAIPIGSIIGITLLIGGFLLAWNALQKAYTEYNIRQLPPDQQAAARAKLIGQINEPVIPQITNSVYVIGGIILLALFLPKLMNKK